jgi:Fibronectin type III domain
MKKGLLRAVASVFWLVFEEELFAALPNPQGTQTVELAWNASTDPSVEGYCVYYGQSPDDYGTKLDVGLTTTASIQGLVPGHTYYFSATSYNAGDVESVFASPVSYTVPFNLTVAPSEVPGSVIISFPVVPDNNYQLQTSPDLKNWSTVLTFPSLLTNSIINVQAAVGNSNSQFYRIVSQ